MFQGSLEKTIAMRKIESSRKRVRANMRWIDSVKEALGMNLQELRELLWTGHCEHHSFIGMPGGGADSTACNIHGVRREEKN